GTPLGVIKKVCTLRQIPSQNNHTPSALRRPWQQQFSVWENENVQPKNGQMAVFPEMLPVVIFHHLTIFLP
ncbi:MAG: hypothetical protein LBI94_00330, partial [Treponema sp.]|nr:hypothetical protein [Treponema sp.]